MNTWGKNIRLSIFGESHGPAVGIVIDGLPAGTPIDRTRIIAEMKRRAPGNSGFATTRKETDEPRILSGVKEGLTTGAPLACCIENRDQHSSDYDSHFRPGHADWTAFLKYKGHADMAGGGHFSGRLTAPIVFAGAIAKGMLSKRGIEIRGRIRAIGDLDDGLDLTARTFHIGDETDGVLKRIMEKEFPAADEAETAFQERILTAKREGDSVGGQVEAVAIGDLAGLGEPFFGSVESHVASLLFSVPAVKGVEFGRGFSLSALRGSEANDPLRWESGEILSLSNNNGGLLGGIANGMPIIVRAAIKPTASIAAEQDSVDGQRGKNIRIQVRGRHDPCIAPRAVPVVESVLALALLDLSMEMGK